MLSTLKQVPRYKRAWRRALAPAATALVFAGAMALPGLCTIAACAPSETNQSLPGLADTPGTKPSLPAMDRALNGGVLKTEHGLAVLDSDVLLKIYFYAYSGLPVDDSAILTENTENIVRPPPVQASAAQAQEIERLIQAAKAHPDVLIKVSDIALDAYDKATQAYPLDNRLFIKGVGYYFDNSPYHYVYTAPEFFRKLHCTDPRTIAILDPAIANFEHFSMDIVAHVQGAQGKSRVLELDLRSITLRDTVGGVLITQSKGS